MELKLKKQLRLGDGASFQFGIPDSDAIEHWDKGMKLMGKLDSVRKLQWTVHYRLNQVQ